MAHLEVKPKKSFPLWLWVLLAVIVIGVIFAIFRGSGNKNSSASVTDSVTTDSLHNGDALATTEPDWNAVDFNSPAAQDADITDKDITVSGTDQYTIYTLGENILFSTDKNEIQASGDAKLKQIAESFKKHFSGGYIGVYGGTDSTGTAGHNKELGAERALVVKDWLVNKGELPADKLSVHTLGETEPVASNATKAGRQQNRNVQIVVFKGAK
jgi:outer membrane protein OmpA-like peptidoglycan-associated protein